MPDTSTWKLDYTLRAEEIWAEYQREHDLCSLTGKVAGIEPVGGRVWIGDSAVEVAAQMEAVEVDAPVYLIRIGYDHFVRKGRR
jgi:hypothetical protein